MEQLKYFVILCAAVVIIGVLLLLYIREICRRKNTVNRMDEELRIYKGAADHMGEVYERLFPKKFLELFGVRKTEDISTKLSRSFNASVISVNTLDYTQAIHTMESGELFTAMNEIFAGIIPLIAGSGGVIDKFDKASMTGLYTQSGENALMAAISMCEAVDAMVLRNGCTELSVGLDYGEVMLGIAGHHERMAPVALSETISMAEFLRNNASRYGARILATDKFTGGIVDFDKNYNRRFLGYFYDSSRERMIKVYDIYDGDTPEQKQGKRRTRLIFEQGVDRFVHGSYKEARLYFVEVLKADRYDLAARAYLYLCDTYSDASPDEVEICIEKF